MQYFSLLQQLKTSSPKELQLFARSYEIDLSIEEITLLQPLLDSVQIHWLVTGVPNSFIRSVEQKVGRSRTAYFLQLFDEFK